MALNLIPIPTPPTMSSNTTPLRQRQENNSDENLRMSTRRMGLPTAWSK